MATTATIIIIIIIFYAAGPGLEPRYSPPEGDVLPLDDPAKFKIPVGIYPDKHRGSNDVFGCCCFPLNF